MQCSEHRTDLALYTNKYHCLNTMQTGLEACGIKSAHSAAIHRQVAVLRGTRHIYPTQGTSLTTHCVSSSTHTSPTHLSGAGLH